MTGDVIKSSAESQCGFPNDSYVNTTSVIDLACTLVTKPAPVGLALHVTQPSPAPSQSATSTAPGGTTKGNGTPEATGRR